LALLGDGGTVSVRDRVVQALGDWSSDDINELTKAWWAAGSNVKSFEERIEEKMKELGWTALSDDE
jgi:hypothetical protein